MEAAKQEQLKKAKEGMNEWNDTLASDSEADVCRKRKGVVGVRHI